jgi:hypothetical protein
LSSHDLINWAAAPTGLHQPQPWPILVFLCVLLVPLIILAAVRPEKRQRR